MKEDIIKHIHSIQSSMVEPARSCFSETELDNLCCLIRVTVEFCEYLRSPTSQAGGLAYANAKSLAVRCNIQLDTSEAEAESCMSYAIQTIFSGMESFNCVIGSYRSLVGATGSGVQWGVVSMDSLRELFLSTFQEFATERDFVKRLRLLLDLFKMQIVFAGVFYEG